jgi:hypothetical protein
MGVAEDLPDMSTFPIACLSVYFVVIFEPCSCHLRRSCWTSAQMSFYSRSNPGIERGDGLDYGVDALMPALRALIMECIYLLMLSLSLSSIILGTRHSRSLIVCCSNGRFVLVYSRFFDGVAGCQLQSMATAIGGCSES